MVVGNNERMLSSAVASVVAVYYSSHDLSTELLVTIEVNAVCLA